MKITPFTAAAIVALPSQSIAQLQASAGRAGSARALQDTSLSMIDGGIDYVGHGGDKSDKMGSKSGKMGGKSDKMGGKSRKGEYSSAYIMTNAADGNNVQMFRRHKDNGMLEYRASFSTGGLGGSAAGGALGSLSGAGDPLGSSGSLVTIGKCLLASNPGSDTVTSFSIESSGNLVRAGIHNSRGNLPVSIGHEKYDDYHDLVYVLNAGGEGTLAGFKLHGDTCGMEFIPDSEVSLGQQIARDPPFAAASPCEVGFVPGADWLVVLIKGMDGAPGLGTFSLYPVQPGGVLGTPTITVSNGFVPFAIDFDDTGNLLSVEAGGTAFPGTATSSAMTSYKIDPSNGSLEVIQQESIQNEAGCWFKHSNGCVVTSNGDGGKSISTLMVDNGALTLLESTADEVVDGAPIDLFFSMDGKFLYLLVGGRPGIYVYEVDGCVLTRIQVITTGVPVLDATVNGVVGLALYN